MGGDTAAVESVSAVKRSERKRSGARRLFVCKSCHIVSRFPVREYFDLDRPEVDNKIESVGLAVSPCRGLRKRTKNQNKT